MSDLHIADKGIPIWDTDTLAHFDAAVERIRTEEVNIDAIFITPPIASDIRYTNIKAPKKRP